MNYQVLARKYRPQRFGDVAGQQHVTVTLMNALEQGRVAHGYIFSGHRGIGKTTVARILAMALNCRTAIGTPVRSSAEPCGVCESCTEVREGNSVDVIEIDAATNRGIDEIRELRDAARYRPARDRYKIYILDEAHQITDAAFNALLKTLEEPPEHIVFMMATTQPEDIPQTVRSRCQHFSFRAVKLADILSELRTIAEREGIDATDSALNLIAEAGDGSMRDALSVMDQAIASASQSGGRPRLEVAQIREMLGAVSNLIFERMLEAINAGRAADLITTANELLDAGNSPVQLARQLVRYLRNALFAKISGIAADGTHSDGDELLQISDDERRRAARSANLFTEEELTRFLQVTLRTFDEVSYRQEPRLHFELGLLKLLHLRRLLPVEELLSQLPTSAPNKSGGQTARPTSAGAIADLSREGSSRKSSGGGTLPAVVASVSAVRETAAPSPFEVDRSRRSSGAEEMGPGRSTGAEPDVTRSAGGERLQPEDAGQGQGEREQTDADDPAEPSVTTKHGETAGVGETKLLEPADGSATTARDPDALDLQSSVVALLSSSKGQSAAADALAEAEWSVEGTTVRAQTQLSKTMLGVVLNAEAHQLVRQVLARTGHPGVRFEAVPVAPGKAASGRPAARAARAGSVEARAQQHPIVQEAQRLFKAEIRNVIDLSSKS